MIFIDHCIVGIVLQPLSNNHHSWTKIDSRYAQVNDNEY